LRCRHGRRDGFAGAASNALPGCSANVRFPRAWPIVERGLASGTAHVTLPWTWYSDRQTLPLEQERIFRRGWQGLVREALS